MKIEILGEKFTSKPSDVVVFCYAKTKNLSFDKELKTQRQIPLKSGDFTGKKGEISLTYLEGKGAKRCLLLGLGENPTLDSVRSSFGDLTHFCKRKKWKHCLVVLPQIGKHSKEEVLRAILDGICFTNYHFDLKGKREQKPHFLEKVSLVGIKSQMKKIAEDHLRLFEGINLTRDLVNGNADQITPQYLGNIAKKIGRAHSSVKVSVFDKKRIEKEKMGFLLAVNRGSSIDPAFIILEYNGNPRAKDKTVVVGKGVTYDTGGLSLKPTASMDGMKADMTGGAIVLGIIKAAALLKLKVNITGVIPSTDNAISSKSYKIGDVYVGHSGMSVEIGNTDAEGRLVLADALSYTVEKLKPTRIVDFATLTGAIEIALGNHRSGLFTTDKKMEKGFSKAGETTGERVWAMPMDPEYKELLKSEIADIRNVGKRTAGSITAAIFLQQFVKKTPWAHLDIAGTSYLDKKFMHTTPATGYGVRLFLQMLQEIHG